MCFCCLKKHIACNFLSLCVHEITDSKLYRKVPNTNVLQFLQKLYTVKYVVGDSTYAKRNSVICKV